MRRPGSRYHTSHTNAAAPRVAPAATAIHRYSLSSRSSSLPTVVGPAYSVQVFSPSSYSSYPLKMRLMKVSSSKGLNGFVR